MAQDITGSRADPLAVALSDPVDWERRLAVARARREAALAQHPYPAPTLDPRPLQPRMPLPPRPVRLPAPARRPDAAAGQALRRPASGGAAHRVGTLLAALRRRAAPAAIAGVLAGLAASARRNPAPVAAAAAALGALLVATTWLATRPAPVATASLTPAAPALTAASAAPAAASRPEAPPLPEANRIPAAEAPRPGPQTPPLAKPAGLATTLALPATGYGARVRSAAPETFHLPARVAAADLLAPGAFAPPAAGVDPALIRSLVATALNE